MRICCAVFKSGLARREIVNTLRNLFGIHTHKTAYCGCCGYVENLEEIASREGHFHRLLSILCERECAARVVDILCDVACLRHPETA